MPTTRAAAAFMGTKKPAIDDDAATEDDKADPALFLSPELLCLVIKQLREIEERMPPLSYRKNITNLPRIALLSRGWADGISEFVNDGASDAGVDPTQLRKIKAAAQKLDLGFLAPDFVETAHRDLGEFDMTEHVDEEELDARGHDHTGSVLNAIMLAYQKEFVDDDPEAEMNRVDVLIQLFVSVQRAYKKFLVVKTIETLAKNKPPANYEETPWAEKCCASPLIECVCRP